jgi:hypothetical protein
MRYTATYVTDIFILQTRKPTSLVVELENGHYLRLALGLELGKLKLKSAINITVWLFPPSWCAMAVLRYLLTPSQTTNVAWWPATAWCVFFPPTLLFNLLSFTFSI